MASIGPQISHVEFDTLGNQTMDVKTDTETMLNIQFRTNKMGKKPRCI